MTDDLFGVIARRVLADGRLLDLTPLTFGRVRLCVGPADLPVYDDLW